MFISRGKGNPSARRAGPAAVVMGLTAPGVALARSLGRAGINVIGVSSAEDPPAAYSRLFSFRTGPPLQETAAALRFYVELGEELHGDTVLFPTGDQSVHFISAHRAELDPPLYRYLLPLPHDVDRITSKRHFAALADELQLPMPRTVLPDDSAELQEAASSLRFPCVLKPEFTHLWRTQKARSAGLGQTKAVPAADKEELRSRYEELARVDRALVVQEMVLGPDENHVDYHALVDGAGALRGEFAGKKLRLTPPHFGVGSYVESVDPSEVSQTGRLVLERLGFRGMANMNFKRDDRDGRLYLLELNPRFSNWTGLDIACGIDFADLYYMACVGAPYDAPSRYGLGKRWLNFAADRESMKIYAREGTCSWPRWAWSIARSSSWSLYAPTDPGPAWVHLRRTARRRIGGLLPLAVL